LGQFSHKPIRYIPAIANAITAIAIQSACTISFALLWLWPK
jgi:hypothetical protein